MRIVGLEIGSEKRSSEDLSRDCPHIEPHKRFVAERSKLF
jgi:hypothetical protein